MKYFCILVLLLLFDFHTKGCSIFYATDGKNIFAGKNVDWEVPECQIRFVLSTINSYGYVVHCIKYLSNSFSVNGGFNDKGLFIEWADILLPRDPGFQAKGTVNYNGDISIKILTSCATVEEVESFFQTFSTSGFSSAHLLVGDRSGNSVVIERAENNSLAFIRNGESYQIATNYLNSYLDNPITARFVGCYRYNYINEMLKNNKDISVDLFRTILDGAGNKGQKYPTIYSIIYDLKNLDVYAYRYSNYEEVLKFNLTDELAKGDHYFLLPQLFSGLKGIYPVSDDLVTASSVNLSWYGDADDNEILLSTDKDFTVSNSIKTGSINFQKSSLPGLLIIILFLSFILIPKNRRLLVAGVFLLAFFSGCEKDLVYLPGTVSSIEHSKTLNGLLPDKKYYWKIIATGNKGYKTESKVYSFITSDFK
jgi:hypothetical protein